MRMISLIDVSTEAYCKGVIPAWLVGGVKEAINDKEASLKKIKVLLQ